MRQINGSPRVAELREPFTGLPEINYGKSARNWEDVKPERQK
jgi:hypothetical protein